MSKELLNFFSSGMSLKLLASGFGSGLGIFSSAKKERISARFRLELRLDEEPCRSSPVILVSFMRSLGWSLHLRPHQDHVALPLANISAGLNCVLCCRLTRLPE